MFTKENKAIDPIRIIGVILLCWALFGLGRLVIYETELMGLTPDKCTAETTGVVVSYNYGTQMQYGGHHGHAYSVYYDVLEYEVNGQKYYITSRHAQTSMPILGATTTVHYNPTNPAKAYDNSPPHMNQLEFFYPVMNLLICLVMIFRLDKKLKR